jgi:hypothetical protein
MYIITTRRITSGEELKYRNGLAGFRGRGIPLPCPQLLPRRCIWSDSTRLSRNWKGREVEVVVEEQGFRWDDQLYPSLSAAATAIAGTRWNGPRFFGLRDAS